MYSAVEFKNIYFIADLRTLFLYVQVHGSIL